MKVFVFAAELVAELAVILAAIFAIFVIFAIFCNLNVIFAELGVIGCYIC